MIKQVSRESESVMTNLVCDVDGVEVTYTKILGEFAYRMSVTDTVTQERALEVVSALTGVMESQSYDHGAEWRCTGIEVEPKDQYSVTHDFTVRFRIRDIW